jgi:prepilin-type N-terminal cleavage/methylation domain-containing protein
MGQRDRENGWTLIELLLAIAIFSLVAAMGFEVYRATLANLSRAGEKSEAVERSGAILAGLSEELGSLVQDDEAMFVGDENSYPGGRRDSLLFLGNSPLHLDKNERRRGRALIGYMTELDGDDGLLTLYRTETEVLPGVAPGQGRAERYLLARGLRELRLTYHRADGGIASGWAEREGAGLSDEARDLPRAVLVELVFPPLPQRREARHFSTLILLPQVGAR